MGGEGRKSAQSADNVTPNDNTLFKCQTSLTVSPRAREIKHSF